MRIIEGAGAFTAPGSAPNHYVQQLRVDDLSVGTYSIPASGLDDQSPHSEDEVYVVVGGHGRLVTEAGGVPVEPGSVIHVPAGEAHRFTDITEDLAILVLFAPPYQSREGGQSSQPG